MWPFRRRPQGKHALGAAVTAIPSARPAPAPEPAVAPLAPPPVAPLAPPAVQEPTGPRVELGFRDGSTTALAPGSEQARALTDIASLLTRRD